MRKSSMANPKPPECNSISTTEVAVTDITRGPGLMELSFGKRFVKIRSAVPKNGCLVFLWWTEKNKNQKNKKNKN